MERDCSKSVKRSLKIKCEVSHFHEVLQGGCFEMDDRLYCTLDMLFFSK